MQIRDELEKWWEKLIMYDTVEYSRQMAGGSSKPWVIVPLPGPLCLLLSKHIVLLKAIQGFADEELHQHWSEGFRFYDVRLTFQGAALRIGKGVRDDLHRVAHPHRALPTAHHGRGYRDGGPPLGRQRFASLVVFHDDAVIDHRVRNKLEF